jgi:hypothetical protein
MIEKRCDGVVEKDGRGVSKRICKVRKRMVYFNSVIFSSPE